MPSHRRPTSSLAAGPRRRRVPLLFVALLVAYFMISTGRAADETPHAVSGPVQTGSDTASPGENASQPPDSPEDEPAEKTRPLPYDLAPIRVTVLASIDASVAAGSDTRRRLIDELQRILSGRLRPLATVSVRLSVPLLDVGLDGLDQIAASAFEADRRPADRSNLPGKVIGLRLDQTGSQFSVTLREWDGTVQAAGPIRERSTLDRRLLPQVVATLLEDAFRPVAIVTQVEGSTVEMLMRGGELHQPGDRSCAQREGEYQVPFLRDQARDPHLPRQPPHTRTRLR
ncbi:MAG: hypothetical protein ACF8TS_21355, partial [Maioricimonas sp. JB049]